MNVRKTGAFACLDDVRIWKGATGVCVTMATPTLLMEASVLMWMSVVKQECVNTATVSMWMDPSSVCVSRATLSLPRAKPALVRHN